MNDFSRFQRKLLGQILLIAGITILLGLVIRVVLIDGILQAPFANFFVGLCRFFGMERLNAINLYHTIFRNNKDMWLMIGFLALFLILFYFSFSRFTRYFGAISKGVNQLAEGQEGRIELAPELNFMEKQLNHVKETLEKRSQEAREAEQRKNDLVVYLAHDIKTPLTSVIGYLSLLDEAPDMPAEQRAKYVGITLEKAYRLEQLINEFFEITRFNLQTIVLDLDEIHLDLMLMQIADEFFPMLQPEEKQIVVQVQEGLTMRGDADKLARVFNNVLKNAIAYSEPHSTITIAARQEQEQVWITFTNQGKKIPEGKLQMIFEKFYRLDSARTSASGGAGLGLAIAKEIVLAHGGGIEALSEEDETSFCVRLPAAHPPTPETENTRRVRE